MEMIQRVVTWPDPCVLFLRLRRRRQNGSVCDDTNCGGAGGDDGCGYGEYGESVFGGDGGGGDAFQIDQPHPHLHLVTPPRLLAL